MFHFRKLLSLPKANKQPGKPSTDAIIETFDRWVDLNRDFVVKGQRVFINFSKSVIGEVRIFLNPTSNRMCVTILFSQESIFIFRDLLMIKVDTCHTQFKEDSCEEIFANFLRIYVTRRKSGKHLRLFEYLN